MATARLLTGAIYVGRYRRVAIFGETSEELGVPLVELKGSLEYLQHLTIQQAEELAAALLMAAQHARGDVVQTALDDFLAKHSG